MSHYNYENRAFMQDDDGTYNRPAQPQPTIVKNSPARVHRSESIRSFHSVAPANRSLRSGIQRINSGLSLNCSHHQLHQPTLSLPPRPGPKSISSRVVEGNAALPKVAPFSVVGSRYGSISDVQNQSTSGRYALVPVEELNTNAKGRYAVVPAQSASRFVKSQENLDRFVDQEEDEMMNYSDQFCSLPPMSSPKKENGMMPAFSTDFGSKSFILFDQKSQQRYAVFPTEENEEIVDDNHEIIQMHNGKAHRYAVIPTDEEETCLNGNFDKPTPPNYAVTMSRRTSPQRTPQKQLVHQRLNEPLPSLPSTPKKSLIATQKLHELLTTPQKQSPFIRHNSTPLSPKNSPYRARVHHASNPRLAASGLDFTPQKLQYEQKMRMASTTTLNLEQRTTAVIQPRLNTTTAASIYNETTTTTTDNSEKHWHKNLKSHKNAIATIGFVSLLLMFFGVVNSGLCIYMTSMSSITALYVSNGQLETVRFEIFGFPLYLQTGRSLFLDIGILSGFATVALSFLGFKFRFSDWTPNRNYISGN